MTLRIVVADDHPIFRDGLVRSVEEGDGLKVVGIGASADEAVALVDEHRPDLVLLDISMPGNGIDAARRIARDHPGVRVAMLTVSENDHDVLAAMRTGAIGYILKGVSADELVDIIRELANGRAHVSPSLAARVLSEMQKAPPEPVAADTRIADLTRREEEILRRVAKGLSNREVAEALGLQEKTVKHYMSAILEKLQVRNRVEAALLARDNWGAE